MSDDSQNQCEIRNADFISLTGLGKKFIEILNRAIAKGMKLLSVEEIEKEVEERRK